MNPKLVLREITASDCPLISEAFKKQGWIKPISIYEKYLQEQEDGVRDVIIAELDGSFVGYLTIQWNSDYQPFQQKEIPEIVDFNVLKAYQRRRIGTRLMDEAEKRIGIRSNLAGIGFGVYGDYGPAQILYIKRGYIPDGNGLTIQMIPVHYGQEIVIDDSVAIYLIKEL